MVKLDGQTLTLEKLDRILYQQEQVVVSSECMDKVQQSRDAVDAIVNENRVIYGITTGFGKFSDVFIDQKHVEDLQLNLIRSHACGVGEVFSEQISRAMLVLRTNALLKGFSGVRRDIIELLVELTNAHITPVIPQQGSLGASGDLAPLSHLALVLLERLRLKLKPWQEWVV